LEKLLDNSIENITDVLDTVELISDFIDYRDPIFSIGELKKLMSFMKRIYEFIKENVTVIESEFASDITINSLNIFSHMIDQIRNNATNSDRTELASQILLHIQGMAFILSCELNDTNQTQEILNNNIFVKIYRLNINQDLVFKINNSSIRIPRVIISDENKECNNLAIGAFIKGLGTYLIEDLNDEQKINSEILAFSLSNSNGTSFEQNGTKVIIR
jgi:hypothetical protein